MRQVKKSGLGHQPGHEGHTDPSAGPRCPRAPPRLRQAARCSFPRTGEQVQPRCLPCWGGPVWPPTPSRTWAPRHHAGARLLPVRWAPAFPLHWGLATPGPRNAVRRTSWLTGGVRLSRGPRDLAGGTVTPPPPAILSVYFFSVSFCPCLPGPLGLDKLPPTSPPCPLTA